MATVSAESIVQHYSQDNIFENILGGLEKLGKKDSATSKDLDPADEFHVGGRDSANYLWNLMGIQEGQSILDVGCGLGGPARCCEESFKASVVGIDLTPSYVAAGNKLSALPGVKSSVVLKVGNALDMSVVADSSMDHAYMLHVAMSISDKEALGKEVFRVLKPGGKFGVFDIMAVEGKSEVPFPLPFSETSEGCALSPPKDYKTSMEAAGFTLLSEEDRTEYGLKFGEGAVARITEYVQANGGPPPLGLHFVMGPSGLQKLKNLTAGFKAGCIAPTQQIYVKPS